MAEKLLTVPAVVPMSLLNESIEIALQLEQRCKSLAVD